VAKALLHLLVLDYGIILVGDINPQALPRKLIRSRMIAISQDPFILKMSLRQIIDPCLSVSDEPILEALAKVKSGLRAPNESNRIEFHYNSIRYSESNLYIRFDSLEFIVYSCELRITSNLVTCIT
jgi:ABC-type multidrug transport system fused ATPase/permease subunit